MLKRVLALVVACRSLFATEPTESTKRWWSYTEALANDKREGRDTGSAGYRAAEDYVITHFRTAGLIPAGTDGFRQPVSLHSAKLNPAASKVEIVRKSGSTPLVWFGRLQSHCGCTCPSEVGGKLFFLGNDEEVVADKLTGAVVVPLGVARIRTAGSSHPLKIPGGALATITVDSLSGPEPPIWPLPYAASVTLAANPPASPANGSQPVAFRFNPAEAEALFAGSGHTYAELKRLSDSGAKLPNFALAGDFRAELNIDESDFTSDNIIGVFPGSDPALKTEYVVLSAHLDGYGIGEPRRGDGIYNGAFDDAAYVALLMDLAESLHADGTRLKRSLLFCIVTGEEKGLLGSRYFAAHPTVPKEQLVADLNLDQLRPIFPLKTLTVLALKESTLGETVQKVAAAHGIRAQEDPEPERNLLRRSDHYSFMGIGVPAVNFVFGYAKGSPDEKVYRTWYAERYHSPADDLNQPWVPEAAARFNEFYASSVEAVANAPDRLHWAPGSQFAK